MTTAAKIDYFTIQKMCIRDRYHTLGAYKWEELGYTYALKDVLPPDKALVKHANELLHTAQYDS